MSSAILTFAIVCALVVSSAAAAAAAAAAAEEEASAEASETELASAAGVESMVVYGRAERQLGVAASASEGRVARADLELRPIGRVGELLEAVPGLIATQHSGAGKSNQLFLRGFNLDHGTDFAAHLDGVPLNFRTHGHGQGYLDLNLLIPELVESIDFRKGPYRADVGDFASAGSSFLKTFDQMPDSIASLTVGEDHFLRGLVAANVPVESGEALIALEGKTFEDPFDLDADLLQINAFAKWTLPVAGGTLRTSALGYYGEWTSTDQIPRRAVRAGNLSRLGFIDPDLGGETTRVGLTFDWQEDESDSPLALSTYFIYYRFKLFSNFTYFLDDDVNGDEFAQRDERIAWGARGTKDARFEIFGQALDVQTGFDTRLDVIPDISLLRTAGRQRVSTVRRDNVTEWSGSLFGEAVWSPSDFFTARAGLRGDLFVFDVDARDGVAAGTNSGREVDGLVSPKLSFILRPHDDFEIYLNGGGGFHSNDARGTTISIDPASEDPLNPERVDSVDPLARQWGAEIGARWQPSAQAHLTTAFWWLDSESELVFVGDAGTTEAQGSSRRYGVELNGFIRPVDWLAFDASYTYSWAEFRSLPSGADRIPGAIESVVAAGATVTFGPLSGSLRVRHFGAYPLIEDNSKRAGGTTLLNLGAGYDVGPLRFGITVVNLLDSKDSDIEYFFPSRLEGPPAEPAAGEEDVHFHPAAPRQVRASVTARF
ncbi:MAG: TonB-dependent receptor [Myxococcota bacterium]